jgi:4-amino-4-deoxy-L-arabinose transferase-like glycosyltransferase
MLAATLLQVAWLMATGWTGASSDWARLAGISLFCLLSAGLVLFVPDRWIESIHQVINQPGKGLITNSSRIKLLILLLAGFILIGIGYILFQRIWSDEEQSYYAAKTIVQQGFKVFFEKYPQNEYLANNHPPLMPILYAGMMKLLGISYTSMRLLAFFFLCGLLIAMYGVGSNLFDHSTGLLSSVLLFTFPLIPRLGTAAMLDIPMTFFFLLSIWLFLILLKWSISPQKSSTVTNSVNSHSRKFLPYLIAVGLGFTMALSALTRYTGLLVLPVVCLFLLLTIPRGETSRTRVGWRFFLQFGIAFAVFCILFAIWMLISHRMGLTIPMVSRIFPIGLNLNNPASQVTIVSLPPGWIFFSGEAKGWILNILLTRLPSAIGVYHFPALLVAGLTAFQRQKPIEMRLRSLILLGWVAVVFLAIILTLPDHRYFMPAFPALALLIAAWLKDRPKFGIRYTMLSILFLFSALALLIDWNRQAQLFKE